MLCRTLRKAPSILRHSCASSCQADYHTRSHVYRCPQVPPNCSRSYSTPQNGATTPLSPHYISLYRLFLRSTAASVLADPEATSTLRRLWRPVFVQAAAVMRQLDRDDLPPEQREALTHWVTQWETRVDNNLSLLYSSALSHGLAHQVTRNLYLARVANNATIDPPPSSYGGVWDGQLPPDDARYKPGAGGWTRRVKNAQQREKERLGGRAMDVLSDLIGMAEGSAAVALGRVQRRR